MNLYLRWMSFNVFQQILADYPGPKVGLSTLTEEQFGRLSLVVGTRMRDRQREYLLDLAWAFRVPPRELFRPS
jgi:hypothetical protein